jgi:hypothetical protein
MPPTDASLREELATLFTAVSTDAARRVTEVRFPQVVASEQRQKVIRDKSNLDAWQSRTAPRKYENILVGGGKSLARLAPLLSTDVISLTERCATQLTELNGSNLPFFSPLGDASWTLVESAEDFETEIPADYERNAPDWTSRRLLLPALFGHLKMLPNLRSVSDKAAQSFASEVLKVATAPNLEYKLSIPLSGLTAKSHIASAQGDAALRGLTAEEQGRFLSEWGIISGNFGAAALPMVVLELIIPTARSAHNPDGREVVSQWLCALFLNGYYPAGYRAQLQSYPSWVLPVVMNIPVTLPSQPAGWVNITPIRFQKICETVKELARYSVSDPRSVHDLALHRFYSGAARSNHVDGILDFAIALEALLLPYDEESRRGDLSYRFRIHGGYFISTAKNERSQVARQLTNLYNLRSGLVHGGKYPAPADIDSGWSAAKQLAQRGLCRAITDGFPTSETFKNMILGT